jgi:hypothetical protein
MRPTKQLEEPIIVGGFVWGCDDLTASLAAAIVARDEHVLVTMADSILEGEAVFDDNMRPLQNSFERMN